MKEPRLLRQLKSWVAREDKAYAFRRRLRLSTHSFLSKAARALRSQNLRIGVPRSTFSSLRMVEEGSEGRVVLRGQELKPATGNSLRLLAGMGQNGRQPWPIFWSRHRNAHLVASSLCMVDDKKRLMIESAFGEEYHGGDPAAKYVILPKAAKLEGPWTSVIHHYAFGSYFHWLMDTLPRLALLDEFPTDTRILVPLQNCRYINESLQLLGIAGRAHPTNAQHLVIEDYYFSSLTAMTGCDNPYAIHFLRDKFLPHADRSTTLHERIFIQRKSKARGFKNEAAVTGFFAKQGWSILDLEDFSFAQQIQLFANAKIICGLHGAAFTNLVWCPPGTVAVELCGRNFLNGCYEGIASYVGVDHRFLVFDSDRNFKVDVDLNQLASHMARWS